MSPELVRSVTEWLTRRGEGVGLALQCCGATLDEMGLEQRSADYSKKLWTYIKQTGATTIVTACPTCYSQFTEIKENHDVGVVSLFQLMANAGVRIPAPNRRKLTVHDSCTDRLGREGSAVREMLRGTSLVEMRHHGQNTICCGSGGLVSAVAPEICEQRARKRLKEVDEVEADICVTYCMTCAHRFSRTERNGGKAIEIRHILELVFGASVDHRGFEAKARTLFEGERGEKNSDLLQHSKLSA
jgi:Fe-S oxidoreductase